jgi:hypothetical protein
MYAQFFRFPTMDYWVDLPVVLLALGISAAAGILGAWGAVRRAAILPAAEAMRPEPPASYRPTAIERMRLQEWFTQSARMVLRELERKPGRAALTVEGLQTETQWFPLVVSRATYGFAVTVTLVGTLLSALVVRRRLDQLDLVAVLKARE